MRNMVVLLDANVLLDYLGKREPDSDIAEAVLELCASESVKGYIAFHSVSVIYYVLRKQYSDEERRGLLKSLLNVVTVIGASHERVYEALERDDFFDFEDCLIDECAVESGAEYIITRNVKDFENAKIRAVLPEKFLEMVS